MVVVYCFIGIDRPYGGAWWRSCDAASIIAAPCVAAGIVELVSKNPVCRAPVVVRVEAELLHARPIVVLRKLHLDIASHLAGGHGLRSSIVASVKARTRKPSTNGPLACVSRVCGPFVRGDMRALDRHACIHHAAPRQGRVDTLATCVPAAPIRLSCRGSRSAASVRARCARRKTKTCACGRPLGTHAPHTIRSGECAGPRKRLGKGLGRVPHRAREPAQA